MQPCVCGYAVSGFRLQARYVNLDNLRLWQVVPTILVPSNIPLYGGKVMPPFYA